MGGRRVAEICARFADVEFDAAVNALLARNRRAMKHLIGAQIGEAPMSFEDGVCDDGRGAGPFKIKGTMWREGKRLMLDFAGTDPQSASSINFYLNENIFKMFFGICMIMVFDPQILFNDGFYDLAASMAGNPGPCIAANKSVFQMSADKTIAEGVENEIGVFVRFKTGQRFGKEGDAAYRRP